MDSMELPEDVKEQLASFEAAVASVEHGLEPLLGADRRELEAQLNPVERAKVHVTLANAVSTLFCIYLKAVGLDPADHAVKRELERVELYRTKVDKADTSVTETKKPPGVKLDVAAADRFIQHHTAGHLSAEQKEALKEKKTKKGGRARGSAAEEAEAFLEGITPQPAGSHKRKSTSTGGGGKRSGKMSKKIKK